MDATAILERLNSLGVRVIVSGERLQIEPGSKVPSDLVNEIRRHKSEIINVLSKPKLVDGLPAWHAETIAEAVRREGVCLFWSDLFGEVIAFIRDDSFKGKVPAGLVTYTSKELKELFGEGKLGLSAADLRLIHEAKRAGGRIASHQDSRGQG